MNSTAAAPISVLTARSDNAPKAKAPSTMPASAPGARISIKRLSQSGRSAQMPTISITQRMGGTMPAAWHAGIISAIAGTARLAQPEAKPPLLMPAINRVGTAIAENHGSATGSASHAVKAADPAICPA